MREQVSTDHIALTRFFHARPVDHERCRSTLRNFVGIEPLHAMPGPAHEGNARDAELSQSRLLVDYKVENPLVSVLEHSRVGQPGWKTPFDKSAKILAAEYSGLAEPLTRVEQERGIPYWTALLRGFRPIVVDRLGALGRLDLIIHDQILVASIGQFEHRPGHHRVGVENEKAFTGRLEKRLELDEAPTVIAAREVRCRHIPVAPQLFLQPALQRPSREKSDRNLRVKIANAGHANARVAGIECGGGDINTINHVAIAQRATNSGFVRKRIQPFHLCARRLPKRRPGAPSASMTSRATPDRYNMREPSGRWRTCRQSRKAAGRLPAATQSSATRK